MGRAASLLVRLRRPRVALGAGILAALIAYYALVHELPDVPTWADVLIAALGLIPATFALVYLVLPLRTRRGVLAVALGFVLLAVAWDAAGLDVAANFAKLAAATGIAFWFLSYFERLSWVVAVAAVIPLVDAFSVWRGPTRHIVTEQPEVFSALAYTFPVPRGSFELGMPDVLFFALFLGAAARWGLRVGWTWLALVASFDATMVIAIYADPFGIGGLPALPGLSLGFLAANADQLWRELRGATIAPSED